MKIIDITKDIDTNPNDKQFSVCRFYANGTYEYSARWISFHNAIKELARCANDFDSEIGATLRIIIVDGLDLINVEWVRGQGLVYPTGGMMDAEAAK